MARRLPSISLWLLFVLLSLCPWPIISQSVVKYLPGFSGPLPFYLETGYIGVGELDEDQLFYYFVESENKPNEDPLLLWLVGGPACSGWSGFAHEIGPLYLTFENSNGYLPTLKLREYSWNKVASIIYVDSPVWTGYSYSTGPKGKKTGDFRTVQELYEFLRKWLIAHPQYISNPLYVGGDSYSGIFVPLVVDLIANGIEASQEPIMNLKGYSLGNPLTDRTIDPGSFVPFAHGVNLISEELYEATKKSCQGNYVNPSTQECEKYIEAVKACLAGLNQFHFLEMNCANDFLQAKVKLGGRRSLQQVHLYPLGFRFPTSNTNKACLRSYWYSLSYYWMNDASVREALHIRKGTIGEWSSCNLKDYVEEVQSTLKYHMNLTTRGYRALVYNGDHDLTFSPVGTQKWIKSLNFSIVDDWRPWFVNRQIAGYTRKFANNLTYATVKGAGHTAPEFNPEECLAMIKRWLSSEPL